MARRLRNKEAAQSPWQKHVFEIIFEADTKAGKRFDVILFWTILASVIVVMLESVRDVYVNWYIWLMALEWAFTIAFTIEYLARIACLKKPVKYMTSFFGIVDLLSILPTYVTLFVGGAGSLLIIRILRLMRIFRVLKLIGFLKEAVFLTNALKASRQKIIVFLVGVMMIVTLLGTLMYIIEDPDSGFTSIPRSIYWAIVTLTTVGFGDIAPVTALGQAVASVVMIMGYSIIAVPTGIVGVELARQPMGEPTTQTCPSCTKQGHTADAEFCKYCGTNLHA